MNKLFGYKLNLKTIFRSMVVFALGTLGMALSYGQVTLTPSSQPHSDQTFGLSSGNSSGGGGDFLDAVHRFLGFKEIVFKEQLHWKFFEHRKDSNTYCLELRQKALLNLNWLLERYEKSDRELSQKIQAAAKLADDFCGDSSVFLVEEAIADESKNPLTAVNFWSQGKAMIKLNPLRWEFVYINLGDDEMAEEIQSLIAAHEFLSLVNIECSGDYNLSSIKFFEKYEAYKSPTHFLNASCKKTQDPSICEVLDENLPDFVKLTKVIGRLNFLRNNSSDPRVQREIQSYLLRPGFLFYERGVRLK